jgi:hypothetical protein
MKDNITIILISFLFLFINGCKEEKTKVIYLSEEQQKKIIVGNVTKIIQLETTASSQLGSISKTEIDSLNDRIFVLSDFNVFIFDYEGNFIKKLKKGRGPEEISLVVSFSIDPEKKLLYVLDNTNRICAFDYEGKMSKDFNINGFNSMAIQVLDDKNAFLLCNWVGGNEDKFVGLYNFKEEKITNKFVSSDDSQYPKLVRFMRNNFTTHEDRLFFTSSNIFGLYEYKGDKFDKILSFDLGKRAVPKRFSDKYLEGRRRTIFEDEALKNDYVPFLLYSFYFKGYYFAIVDDEVKSCYAIDEDNFKKVYLNGTLSKYFNLPTVKSFRFPEEINEDYLVLSCNPLDFYDIDETKNTKKIKIGKFTVEINYDSNPFLVIVE